MSPVTRVGKSSQSVPAIRINRDSILPSEPPLTPLVPQPSPLDDRAVVAFYEWAAFDESAIEARAAKRLMDGMGVR